MNLLSYYIAVAQNDVLKIVHRQRWTYNRLVFFLVLHALVDLVFICGMLECFLDVEFGHLLGGCTLVLMRLVEQIKFIHLLRKNCSAIAQM